MKKCSAILCCLFSVYTAYGMEQSLGKPIAAQILHARLLNKARLLLKRCQPILQKTSHTSQLLQSYCPNTNYLKQTVSLLEAEPMRLEEQHSDLLTTLIFAPLACKINLDALAQKLCTSERAGIISEARKNVFLQDIAETLSYAQKISSNASELIKSLSHPQVDSAYAQLYCQYTSLLQDASQEITRVKELSEKAKTALEENLKASPRQSKRHASHKE